MGSSFPALFLEEFEIENVGLNWSDNRLARSGEIRDQKNRGFNFFQEDN
jgi:hypothetical protein